MQKIYSILSLALLPASAVFAQPILFNATLSPEQVTHTLNPASDQHAAHPFYKHECALQKGSADYSKATGHGVFSFNPKTNVLTFTITYSGLSGPAIMSHFHLGAANKSGPIVQTICGRPPANAKALGYSAPAVFKKVCPAVTSGSYTGNYKLQGNPHDNLTLAQEKQALMNGELYVNIHTCLNETGELRGQIYPSAQK